MEIENSNEDDEVESRGIQSVEIAGRLLAALCGSPRDTSLKQLGAAAGMAPAKAHRYMASLVRSGLARQEESGRYALGPLALRLGLAAISHMDVVAAAERGAQALARELGLSVHLNIWGDWGPVVIRLCQGGSPVISTVRLGSVLPLTRSATGLVYLAFAPPALTRPLAEREMAGLNHPLDNEALATRVERTRDLGFGAVDGLLIPGLVAICAPVFDFQRELACAISVTGTDHAITDADGPYATRLLETCLDIARECGGSALARTKS